MICPSCCDQRCEDCESPIGCFCQHKGSKIPLEWLDQEARHEIAMCRRPAPKRPRPLLPQEQQNGRPQ